MMGRALTIAFSLHPFFYEREKSRKCQGKEEDFACKIHSLDMRDCFMVGGLIRFFRSAKKPCHFSPP